MPQLHSTARNFYEQFFQIRRKLNEISARYWTDLEIYNWLNQAQLFITRKTKILKKEITVTTVDDQREYDLKDNSFGDIIDIDEDGVTFLTNGTTRQEIFYRTKKQLNREFPGWQTVTKSLPRWFYYNKATKTIGLHPKPNSTNAGAYLFINGFHKPLVLNAGTAAGGSATTITLATGSDTIPFPNPTDDYYNGLFIEIYNKTGAGQKVEITDYDGGTRKCTASFSTAPDSTSVYGMVPEIPEEMQYLMPLYAFAKAFEKGGSRTNLANNYWNQFVGGLNLAIGESIEEDDEDLVSDTYR